MGLKPTKISFKEFQIGEHVYLRVRPRKSTLSTGSCARLALRYCEPFKVLDQIAPIAYQLALPAQIKVHNVFHVSLLKKYVHDGTHVIGWHILQVEPEGYFLLEPLYMVERREIVLRNRVISLVKVQWRHFTPKEENWEKGEVLRAA